MLHSLNRRLRLRYKDVKYIRFMSIGSDEEERLDMNRAEKVDYYAVLRVDHDATADEIKRQFRDLAKQHHPDMVNNHSEDIIEAHDTFFKLINEAYTVLSNPTLRARYDQLYESMKFEGKGLKYGKVNKGEIGALHTHFNAAVKEMGDDWSHYKDLKTAKGIGHLDVNSSWKERQHKEFLDEENKKGKNRTFGNVNPKDGRKPIHISPTYEGPSIVAGVL